MAAMRSPHGDHLERHSARGRWLRRLLWAAFAFAIFTCYSAQVAHLYKGDHGARQCERCQGDLHVVSEPVALQYASAVLSLPRYDHVVPYRSTSLLQDPRGITPRGRAPPSILS